MNTIVGEALRCQRVSGSVKLVLVALADCANDAGVSWPSVGYLASVASVDARSVQRILTRLEAIGLLKRGDRPGRSTVYELQRAAFALPLFDDPKAGRGRRAGKQRTPDSSVTPDTTVTPQRNALSRGNKPAEPPTVVSPVTVASPLTLASPTPDSSVTPVQSTDPSRNLSTSTHTPRAREASTTPRRATNGRGEHRPHAWCSPRVCVPTFLHQELCGQLGGVDAHTTLLAWYPEVIASIGDAPIPDALGFWRAAFRAWQRPAEEPVEAPRASRRPVRAPAHRIPAGYGPSVGLCEHDPPCEHYDQHRTRWLDEERAREGLPPRASTAARATRGASSTAVA